MSWRPQPIDAQSGHFKVVASVALLPSSLFSSIISPFFLDPLLTTIMLQVPIREQSGQSSTKAVILVSDAMPFPLPPRATTNNSLVNRSVAPREALDSAHCRLMSRRYVPVYPSDSNVTLYRRKSNQNTPTLAPVRSRRSPHYPPLLEGNCQGSRCSRSHSGRIL